LSRTALGASAAFAMATSIAAARMENAQRIHESQRATSAAMYALKDVKKAPVPYMSSMAAPELHTPVPRDDHLVRTCEWVVKEELPEYTPDEALPAVGTSHGKPWATFQAPTPAVFQQTPVWPPVNMSTPAPEDHISGDSAEMSLTQFKEWSLQINGFNTDYAAHQRISVHKQASVVAEIEKEGLPKKDLYNSNNIKVALGEARVMDVPPSKPITFEQALPKDKLYFPTR